MSVRIDVRNRNQDPRRAMLEQAARTVSKVGEAKVEIDEVADLAEVDLDIAHTLFSDNAGLLKQLREFLNSRFDHFANLELKRLPAETPAIEVLERVAHGYFCFSQEEKQNFGAFISLSTTANTSGFDAEFEKVSDRPSFRLIMNLIRRAIIEIGGPRDEWLLVSTAATVFATIHGFCHLSTFGITRYLSDAAKKQTLSAVIRTLFTGIKPVLAEGLPRSIVPTSFVGPMDFPQPQLSKDMPKTNDDEKRRALWRSAIEQSMEAGLSTVTLYRAAERAGIDMPEAVRLLDGDEKLLRSLENYLDECVQGFIGSQVSMVKEGSSALSYLKAIGFGYVGYALSDPDAFITLIAVSSGSIVPTSFDVDFEMSEMGVAFSFLMDITRQAIEEGNGPRNPWELYTQVFALWSTAHGLAHLFSAGALRHLTNREKFALLGPALDIIFCGMEKVLGLDLPQAESVEPQHIDIARFER